MCADGRRMQGHAMHEVKRSKNPAPAETQARRSLPCAHVQLCAPEASMLAANDTTQTVRSNDAGSPAMPALRPVVRGGRAVAAINVDVVLVTNWRALRNARRLQGAGSHFGSCAEGLINLRARLAGIHT